MFLGMSVSIYTVGWYIDAEAAAIKNNSNLHSFKGLTPKQLQSNGSFYASLASPIASYDRTLFVKLAISLPTKTLLDEFLSEITLKEESKAAFAAVRNECVHKLQVCPAGMEILLTWRAAKSGNNCNNTATTEDSKGKEEDYLEIRFGKELYFELYEPADIAADFMQQLFNADNSVLSDSTRLQFATFFHSMMLSWK